MPTFAAEAVVDPIEKERQTISFIQSVFQAGLSYAEVCDSQDCKQFQCLNLDFLRHTERCFQDFYESINSRSVIDQSLDFIYADLLFVQAEIKLRQQKGETIPKQVLCLISSMYKPITQWIQRNLPVSPFCEFIEWEASIQGRVVEPRCLFNTQKYFDSLEAHRIISKLTQVERKKFSQLRDFESESTLFWINCEANALPHVYNTLHFWRSI